MTANINTTTNELKRKLSIVETRYDALYKKLDNILETYNYMLEYVNENKASDENKFDGLLHWDQFLKIVGSMTTNPLIYNSPRELYDCTENSVQFHESISNVQINLHLFRSNVKLNYCFAYIPNSLTKLEFNITPSSDKLRLIDIFSNSQIKEVILNIYMKNNLSLTGINNLFSNNKSLENAKLIITREHGDELLTVYNVINLFTNCTSLINYDVDTLFENNPLNVYHTENIAGMFQNTKFESFDLSAFNFQSVRAINNMFRATRIQSIDLSSVFIKINSIAGCFEDAVRLRDINFGKIDFSDIDKNAHWSESNIRSEDFDNTFKNTGATLKDTTERVSIICLGMLIRDIGGDTKSTPVYIVKSQLPNEGRDIQNNTLYKFTGNVELNESGDSTLINLISAEVIEE